MLIVPGYKPSNLHHPGNSQMNNKPATYTFGIIRNDTEQQTACKTTDRFTHRFSKMNAAIKTRRRYYTMFTAKLYHSNDQKAAEKKFNGYKIH